MVEHTHELWEDRVLELLPWRVKTQTSDDTGEVWADIYSSDGDLIESCIQPKVAERIVALKTQNEAIHR